MLDQWLRSHDRDPQPFCFSVTDIEEDIAVSTEVLEYLAEELVRSNVAEEMLRREYQKLIEDTEDLGLEILKKYVAEDLPDSDQLSARNGIFGEIIATLYLKVFEGFWFPIRKLRFREKRNWAMRLTDLCLFKRGEHLPKPVVCYGEVKTKASLKRNLNIALEGHESLLKDDALENVEVLKFMCARLYDLRLYEEADFISDIRLERIDYKKQYELFIVHEGTRWKDEILERLHIQGLDERLVNFSVKVVLISELQNTIDMLFRNAWLGAEVIVNE